VRARVRGAPRSCQHKEVPRGACARCGVTQDARYAAAVFRLIDAASCSFYDFSFPFFRRVPRAAPLPPRYAAGTAHSSQPQKQAAADSNTAAAPAQ